MSALTGPDVATQHRRVDAIVLAEQQAPHDQKKCMTCGQLASMRKRVCDGCQTTLPLAADSRASSQSVKREALRGLSSNDLVKRDTPMKFVNETPKYTKYVVSNRKKTLIRRLEERTC